MNIQKYLYTENLWKIEIWKGNNYWKMSIHIHLGHTYILIFL